MGIVYNRVALKKGKKRDGTYKYHPVDTECTLVGIETKWFDRAPQATIKIDGKTYLVKSTDLSIDTVEGEADRRANNKKRMQDVCKAHAVVSRWQGVVRGRPQRESPRSSRQSSNASRSNVSRRSRTSSSRHSGSRGSR